MTFREEMMHDMKAKLERQRFQIVAQWWIIGLLALVAIFLYF